MRFSSDAKRARGHACFVSTKKFDGLNQSCDADLSNASGLAVPGATSNTIVTVQDDDPTGAANPIFTTPFFVRQHYLDFISREPEPNEPWSRVLNNCPNVFNLDAASQSARCGRLLVS